LPNRAGFVNLLEQPLDSRVMVESTAGGWQLNLPGGAFGRPRAVLTVLGDRLRVEQHKLGGTQQQEWTHRQLADIRVGRIGDSEGPDTFEVHIDPHPGEGKRARLRLAGEAEARWLATVLRRALGMPDAAEETTAPFLERLDPPDDCPILQEPGAEGI